MVIFLQRTLTSLVHAHAGRTQVTQKYAKRLAFAPSSLILASIYAPISKALCSFSVLNICIKMIIDAVTFRRELNIGLSMQQKVILFLILTLAGCSTRGPMHSFYGPADTPDYTKIMEATLYKNKGEIDFVANALFMIEHRHLGGAITVSSGNLLFSQWNIDSLKYNPVFDIPISKIETYGHHIAFFTIPISLIGRTFYIKSGNDIYYLASNQMDSIYYYIRNANKSAIRLDESRCRS